MTKIQPCEELTAIKQAVKNYCHKMFDETEEFYPVHMWRNLINEIESDILEEIMGLLQYNIGATAAVYGCSRGAMHRKLKRLFGYKYVTDEEYVKTNRKT
jgi:DNA-binding protein Fis